MKAKTAERAAAREAESISPPLRDFIERVIMPAIVERITKESESAEGEGEIDQCA